MATKPLKPCAYPRCPSLTDRRFCLHHAHKREQERGSSAQRGYDAKHRRWRKAILRRDPLCVHCKRDGHTVVARVADHIVPISRGGSRYALSNGQGLCVQCHNRKTAQENSPAWVSHS